LAETQKATLRSLGALDQAADSLPPAALPARPDGGTNRARGLPYQPTSFVGRAAELSELARLLGDPACRLLTLLGPGGIGKTRLALAVAATQTAAFADGVAFVALASVGAPSQVVSAIGDTLSLSFAGHPDSSADLIRYLRERQLLLILDNFEHLLDAAALVAGILEHAPRVRLLITSRERLNLQAEWLFDVGGLAYPPEVPPETASPQHLADLAHFSAIQLFVQRARQVQPSLSLTESSLTTIARICQHVAGMPLAIELAAAGVRALPLAAIEQQIRTNLDLLATTQRDVPARHRSMRAVFEHSWNLLGEPERALFSYLAVFRGGFTHEAAQAVTDFGVGIWDFGLGRDAGTFQKPKAKDQNILAGLAALVDKSLVQHQGSADAWSSFEHAAPDTKDTPRFAMLAPIREYALERLAARQDAEAIRRRHAHYFTALAEAAVAEWDTPRINMAIALQRREHDNMRAALEWACDTGNSPLGLQLAEALWGFWRSYGYLGEGRAWLDRLLRLDEQPADPAAIAARRRALHRAAWLASDQHDYATATRLFEESIALGRAVGEVEGETHLLLNAARQARAAGQYQQATALLETVLARLRAPGNRTAATSAVPEPSFNELGQVLRELALVLRERGDFAGAVALLDEGLELHRADGDRVSVALVLLGHGDVARDRGSGAAVREYCKPSLAVFRELGMEWAIGFALNSLALGAYYEGELARAAALARESEALFRGLQADASLAEALITLGHILRAQGEAAAAHAALAEALRSAQAVGPRLFVAASLEGLAGIMAEQGHAELGVQLLAAAAASRAQMGAPVRPADQSALASDLAAARAALGEDTFAAVWARAQALPLEEILIALPKPVATNLPPDRAG
jgi:predicted ATPase